MPCGMISQATRGRVPEAWGRKFMKLYLEYLAGRSVVLCGWTFTAEGRYF
jgi:hypothetical protein